ncbi:hypothetical protein Ae406Ps2_5854 [Pseudonocardia sp. Ae406_Ps2]|uniref:hypothetical protein n=1 Tax=unclassified Pseudonocardia TaxID=2619320 RepID=UPI00094AB069|nr:MULTISPECIES: hypothetical protein [unclassified Pseudonocardia]OLL96437.1 hypothetical protein Ae331Ps2_0104c [Pseudonocardia sp. Ae331_Ps2]OLM05854.1 hypothetical protein Ae406Ps2_5854 [Pseudonocardia sp. Ae406_Ps2]OLM14988.1 hypothetical protein Ae505Ps2_5120c [Pseudonocardia sp. Ae505_Ps2]OLM27428.1 hypothetical protein Ae706Ps2_5862 [Pseudonocardia sp. Ae706_Ps2]OLM30593.1 hypothetical protein Ae717Ps2_1488 [Pseudonocardia sp. Ae717_Ps2]
MTGFWARLLGREPVPDTVADALADSEAVVATAQAPDGMLVVTSWGIWPPGGERLGWHEIAKATWDKVSLVVTPTSAEQIAPGTELLADGRPLRFRLADPGKVPQAVQERVTQSIRTRNRRELPGGGAWVLQRRVPGRDGLVLQVRPDPGTDPVAARRLAEGIAARLPEDP